MSLIGGLDEVGNGALAGPIVSVVAVFRDKDLALMPPGVTDCKKLSRVKIESLYVPLCAVAFDIGIGAVWPEEIDALRPGPALQISYTRALEDLTYKPTHLIVDGNKRVRDWKGFQSCIPKADLIYKQVSAASIIAKHIRDSLMKEYSKKHAAYGWDHNSGYGSEDHDIAIKKFGLLITPGDYFHRKSYCRKYLVIHKP